MARVRACPHLLAAALLGSVFLLKLQAVSPNTVGSDGDLMSIEVRVDDKMHQVEFRTGDDFPSIAGAFCLKHGLNGEHSKSITGVDCPDAVQGLMEEETRKMKQRRSSTQHLLDQRKTGDIYMQLPKKVFPFRVSDETLKQRVVATRTMRDGTPARLVVSAYVFGHDASLVSICNGRVLGVIELERLPGGRRYFDLAATARKGQNKSERDAIVIDHLSRAQQALADLTFSSTATNHCGVESNKYDAGIIVDAQTPEWMQNLIKKAVPLADGGSWATVNHHYSHALLGWYDSPYYFSDLNNEAGSDYSSNTPTCAAGLLPPRLRLATPSWLMAHGSWSWWRRRRRTKMAGSVCICVF